MKKVLMVIVLLVFATVISHAVEYNALDQYEISSSVSIADDTTGSAKITEFSCEYDATSQVSTEVVSEPAGTANNLGDLFIYSTQSIGRSILSGTTTSRQVYLYDFINGQSSMAMEWQVAKWYPGRQDQFAVDIGAGYIASDPAAVRGELSANISYYPNKLNLFIVDVKSIELGAHIQHGLKGKFGGGSSLGCSSEKIFGFEVSKILETICPWAKSKVSQIGGAK